MTNYAKTYTHRNRYPRPHERAGWRDIERLTPFMRGANYTALITIAGRNLQTVWTALQTTRALVNPAIEWAKCYEELADRSGKRTPAHVHIVCSVTQPQAAREQLAYALFELTDQPTDIHLALITRTEQSFRNVLNYLHKRTSRYYYQRGEHRCRQFGFAHALQDTEPLREQPPEDRIRRGRIPTVYRGQSSASLPATFGQNRDGIRALEGERKRKPKEEVWKKLQYKLF